MDVRRSRAKNKRGLCLRAHAQKHVDASIQKCMIICMAHARARKETQISAIVSETTRDRLEKHVRATGVKKGHLVEQALLHHIQALEELPADVIVHPRIVITRRSFEKVVEQMEKAKPTQALRNLMRNGD